MTRAGYFPATALSCCSAACCAGVRIEFNGRASNPEWLSSYVENCSNDPIDLLVVGACRIAPFGQRVRSRGKPLSQGSVPQQFLQASRQSRHIVIGYKQAAATVLDRLADSTDGRCDDRHADRKGFDDG